MTAELEMRMNDLHVQKTCSSCNWFDTQTSKCKSRKIIVNSDFLSCEDYKRTLKKKR